MKSSALAAVFTMLFGTTAFADDPWRETVTMRGCLRPAELESPDVGKEWTLRLENARSGDDRSPTDPVDVIAAPGTPALASEVGHEVEVTGVLVGSDAAALAKEEAAADAPTPTPRRELEVKSFRVLAASCR